MKICILGAGLTGLTLGYLLSQKGITFDILEKEAECGGLMRTLQKQGFTFDYGGSHIIFSRDKEVLELMLNLIHHNKIKNRRNTKILYKGSYVKYPFENGLSDLPKNDNFECVDYFVKNLIKKEKGELSLPQNLNEWCYYTFGLGIAEKYLIPYNEKIWKYPTERMGLEWVERIPNPPVEDIIKSSLGIDTEGYTHQLNFYYPKIGGIQALIKSLQEKVDEHIITNFKVKAVKKENGNWIISNGKEERSYDKIISTIPIHDLISALDAAPNEIINAVCNLRFNSLITVMIGLHRSKNNDMTWLYIPDRNVLTHRISFPSNYSVYVAPDGMSSILAEITCNVNDEIWGEKDDVIKKRVTEDLHKLKIINKHDICFSELKRLQYAYVINDLDYERNMRIINEYIQEIGIDLLGRFSEFKYLNMDGCIRNVLNYVAKDTLKPDLPIV